MAYRRRADAEGRSLMSIAFSLFPEDDDPDEFDEDDDLDDDDFDEDDEDEDDEEEDEGYRLM